MTQIVYAIWTSFTIPGKNFYTHIKCERYSCMSDTPPPSLVYKCDSNHLKS